MCLDEVELMALCEVTPVSYIKTGLLFYFIKVIFACVLLYVSMKLLFYFSTILLFEGIITQMLGYDPK
jgi:hypothetical protein